MAMFPTEHCISEQQIILASFVKNVLGDGKAAKNLKVKRTKCAGILTAVLGPNFSDDLQTHIDDSKCGLVIA